MILLIFIAAVGVSLVLDRQERRQQFELKFEYERLGWEAPRRKPRLGKLEALLNVILGTMLFAVGGFIFYIQLSGPHVAPRSSSLELTALLMAGGVALVLLGSKALSRHRREG